MRSRRKILLLLFPRRAANLGTAEFVAGDISKSADVRRLMDVATKEFGRIDILVNNAGLQHIASIVEFPEERWDYLIGVILTGTFLCSKYAVPHMIRQKWGRVINIASLHGRVASPFNAAYIAAKHGVLGLTKVLALEAAEHNITSNAICPAYVRTPLVEKQIDEQARRHGISREDVVQKIMLEPAAIRRLLEPDEVAALAVYLCRIKLRESPVRRLILIWGGRPARRKAEGKRAFLNDSSES